MRNGGLRAPKKFLIEPGTITVDVDCLPIVGSIFSKAGWMFSLVAAIIFLAAAALSLGSLSYMFAAYRRKMVAALLYRFVSPRLLVRKSSAIILCLGDIATSLNTRERVEKRNTDIDEADSKYIIARGGLL